METVNNGRSGGWVCSREVMLDERCDGLGQQRDDSGGYSTMHKDKEWRAMMYMYEFQTPIFTWSLCSFGLPSISLVSYQLERNGMPLHDVVGVNCNKGTTTDEGGGSNCWG